MAITINGNPGTDVFDNSTTTLDFTGLTIAAGSNIALVATLSWQGGVPSGITVQWDPAGVNPSLSAITGASASAASACGSALFGLVNPTTGNKTLRATWSGSFQAALSGVAFNGVNQAGGDTTFARGNGQGVTTGGNFGVTIASSVGN